MARRIIACLDVDQGRVVKGVRFQDLRDQGDPAELAHRYEDTGADEIVFLDVSATLEGRSTLLESVRRTAQRLFIPLTVGGGVRSLEDADRLFRAGADKVAVNTAAVEDPSLIGRIAERYGRQAVVVAVDAARAGTTWKVRTRAGRASTGLDAADWCVRAEKEGAGELLLTSIDADGTRAGYDLPLLRAVRDRVRLPVVASGGCGRAEHVLDAFEKADASAALIAGLFHDGSLTPAGLKEWLAQRGIEVRT